MKAVDIADTDRYRAVTQTIFGGTHTVGLESLITSEGMKIG